MCSGEKLVMQALRRGRCSSQSPSNYFQWLALSFAVPTSSPCIIQRHRWERRLSQSGLGELCLQLSPCISVAGFVPPSCLSSDFAHPFLDQLVPSSFPQLVVSAVELLVGGAARSGQDRLDRLAPPCVSPSRCPARQSVTINGRPFGSHLGHLVQTPCATQPRGCRHRG